MTNLSGSISQDCLDNFVFSDPSGGMLSSSWGACDDVDNDGVCDDSDDCIGQYDDCGDCNGDNACYEGSLSLGAFDSEAGTLEVMYDFGAPVAGFQFDLSGLALAGGSGGAAGDAGFDVQAGGSTVLGFSFTGDAIPAGSGLLTVLSFTDVTADATDLSMGIFGALTGPAGVVYASSASGSVDHSGSQDCAGDYYGGLDFDECGVCGGSGIADGACDCDGNVSDCAGVCGGSSVEDECGVCDGSGPADNFDCDGNCVNSSACGSAGVTVTATGSTATVSYDSNFPVGGFQFAVSGVTLTGASSGLGDTQFNSETGVVIGFDFSGATLPAGSGVLAELSFEEVAGGATLVLSDGVVSSGDGVTLLSGFSGSAEVPGCDTDCAGVCNGDAVLDNC